MEVRGEGLGPPAWGLGRTTFCYLSFTCPLSTWFHVISPISRFSLCPFPLAPLSDPTGSVNQIPGECTVSGDVRSVANRTQGWLRACWSSCSACHWDMWQGSLYDFLLTFLLALAVRPTTSSTSFAHFKMSSSCFYIVLLVFTVDKCCVYVRGCWGVCACSCVRVCVRACMRSCMCLLLPPTPARLMAVHSVVCAVRLTPFYE